MARFKLVPYLVKVKQDYSRSGEYSQLNRLQDTEDKTVDFFQIFKSVVSLNGEMIPNSKNTWSASASQNAAQRSIWGAIQYGEYGITTDFFDTHLRTRREHARTDTDSEEMPFFYLYHQPIAPVTDRGFLILLEFKKNGVKTQLHLLLERELKKTNPKLSLIISPIISDELMKELNRVDKILQVKLVAHEITNDIADRCSLPKSAKIREERTFIANAHNAFKPSAIKKMLHGTGRSLRNKRPTMFEIAEEQYNEVKVLVNDNGSDRTLTFGERERLKEVYPLKPDTLTPLRGGFPTITKLLPLAQQYLNSFLRAGGIPEVHFE